MRAVWRWSEDGESLDSLQFGAEGAEWIYGDPVKLPQIVERLGAPRLDNVCFSAKEGQAEPYEAPSLSVRLDVPHQRGTVTHCFQLFPGIAALAPWLEAPEGVDFDTVPPPPREVKGVELDAGLTPETIRRAARLVLPIRGRPAIMRQIELQDATDWNSNLYFERCFHLHRSNWKMGLKGNVFTVEDVLCRRGLAFLKEVPLPHARPLDGGPDLRFNGSDLALCGHGIDSSGGAGYPLVVMAYDGSAAARTFAMQRWRMARRHPIPDLDRKFVVNTWGDCGQDGKLNEDFVRRKVDAARRLGADEAQIDDGWQAGTTSNSVNRQTSPLSLLTIAS